MIRNGSTYNIGAYVLGKHILHFRWSGSATPKGHPATLPDQRKYARATPGTL
jgi:hypothetical protein